jgi:uncharacterized membrane protein YecN with MAPEG domain
MKIFEKWISKLNSNQKLIIAIGLPLALFFITLKVAGIIGFDHCYRKDRPFNFEETWWVWLVFSLIVIFIEYRLFESKNDE